MYKTHINHVDIDPKIARKWAIEKGFSAGSRGRLSASVLDAYQAEVLIETHMNAADSVAVSVWKTATYALDLNELKSIAYEALASVARRWKPYCIEKGFSPADIQFFKPFAQKRIRGAIYDEFRNVDWAGRTLRSRSKLLQSAGQQEGASIEQMSVATGLSKEVVRSTIQGMSLKFVSIDSSDSCLYEKSSDDVEGSVLTSILIATLIQELDKLPFIQQLIVAYRYHQDKTMKNISEVLDIPVAVVSREHSIAVNRLRSAMAQEAKDSEDA